MGKGALTPSSEKEAYRALIIGHIGVSCVQKCAILRRRGERKAFLTAKEEELVVDSSHS
jgi:hypothetical protein